MPIRSRKSQYLGVNAHLQSYLLGERGGWHSFHAEHIVDLVRALIGQLPAGYYARAEKSLQITHQDLLTGTETLSDSYPDVGIYRKRQRDRPGPTTTDAGATPTATVPVLETVELAAEETLNGVVIYRVQPEGSRVIPVTKIELLSTSNKPPRPGYQHYVINRKDTLESGICMVELDYLHETRSTLRLLPSYPSQEPGAHPYLILVSDPRPSMETGQTDIYDFYVDEPVPLVEIPLAGDDSLTFDFGAVYMITFSQNPYYGLEAVDYEQLPPRFDTYSPDDQTRIRRRMEVVREAVEAGHDLEEGLFPLP